MLTIKEFFEQEADDIIEELQEVYGIQRNESREYLNIPFPTKEEFVERYELGIDDPYEELSDIDEFSHEEQEKMIEEQKERICEEYNRICKIRESFKEGIGE